MLFLRCALKKIVVPWEKQVSIQDIQMHILSTKTADRCRRASKGRQKEGRAPAEGEGEVTEWEGAGVAEGR